MSTVCEVCGHIGFKHLLLCCRDCTCSAAHQYCLEKVVFDASLAAWVCYECLQKRSEVTCSRSLEVVLSEKPAAHADFGSSTEHQPTTKRVDSSSSIGLGRERKSICSKYKYMRKLFSSRLNASGKLFKRKPDMQPVNNCIYKRKQIATSTAHAKSLQSCETIGAQTAKGHNGGNQHVENGAVTLNIAEHHNSVLEKYGEAPNGMTNSDANDSCEKGLSCASVNNVPGVLEANLNSVDVSISSQHGDTQASECSERYLRCQKGSFCHRGKTARMATISTSLEESKDIPSENRSLEPDDLQALTSGDYVLSRTSYLSEAQNKRVLAFIQETKPEITVFVSVIGNANVQPPGPCLGISKEYAFAYFPPETTKVTLQIPGMDKTWRVLFYKRNESRKNMLMGRWLDFVRDNNVQEGDICLLEPTKDERKSTFTIYLLRVSETDATGGDGFQRVGPYPGESAAKITSEVHNKEEPSNEKHIPSERVMHEISHESLESEDYSALFPYIVPCRHDLSKSQKKIIEERVRAIRSEVPLYVTVMKNNNAGAAQRWMLEIGVRYAGVYLPAHGQTVVLQRMGKTWNTQMVIHNGRRWFLNGGWTKFARDNGLRVGDVCLFELKKESKVTMKVHIISREQF